MYVCTHGCISMHTFIVHSPLNTVTYSSLSPPPSQSYTHYCHFHRPSHALTTVTSTVPVMHSPLSPPLSSHVLTTVTSTVPVLHSPLSPPPSQSCTHHYHLLHFCFKQYPVSSFITNYVHLLSTCTVYVRIHACTCTELV